jgi:transposase
MVLSWSRALFLDFSLDQRIETFCAMHRRAFEFFGGVPKKVLYDFVARHKIVVLWRIPLRGAAPARRARNADVLAGADT